MRDRRFGFGDLLGFGRRRSLGSSLRVGHRVCGHSRRGGLGDGCGGLLGRGLRGRRLRRILVLRRGGEDAEVGVARVGGGGATGGGSVALRACVPEVLRARLKVVPGEFGGGAVGKLGGAELHRCAEGGDTGGGHLLVVLQVGLVDELVGFWGVAHVARVVLPRLEGLQARRVRVGRDLSGVQVELVQACVQGVAGAVLLVSLVVGDGLDDVGAVLTLSDALAHTVQVAGEDQDDVGVGFD